jgi:hypothetical protein
VVQLDSPSLGVSGLFRLIGETLPAPGPGRMTWTLWG